MLQIYRYMYVFFSITFLLFVCLNEKFVCNPAFVIDLTSAYYLPINS